MKSITIPENLLNDDNISNGAKIIYGKIARLAHKTGYTKITNPSLDGTETGRSASRYVHELIKAGYLESQMDMVDGMRKLFIKK